VKLENFPEYPYLKFLQEYFKFFPFDKEQPLAHSPAINDSTHAFHWASTKEGSLYWSGFETEIEAKEKELKIKDKSLSSLYNRLMLLEMLKFGLEEKE
jgi:hypothetical protein